MSSTPTPSNLSTLPPELLTSILSHLFIKDLLQVSTTCSKVHACTNYIIHQRIRHINNLDGHQLIFECSPPSRRFTTPYHQCQYTGTHPTTPKGKEDRILTEVNPSSIYSHFTPLPLSTSSPPQQEFPPPPTAFSQLVSTTLPFESNEYFTQLYASGALVKRVERVASVLTVFPETFFRIRRSWLQEAAEASGKNNVHGRILWLDEKENIGLRLRIVEIEGSRDNTGSCGRRELWEKEGEKATCFKASYEELVVRSGFLAGVVEGNNETGDIEGVEVLR